MKAKSPVLESICYSLAGTFILARFQRMACFVLATFDTTSTGRLTSWGTTSGKCHLVVQRGTIVWGSTRARSESIRLRSC